ncbi:chorismate mutase [Helcococcus sueciensis]|uniref:chorismate mutase n=1 Tax=Helcococcus sueciensis TaxID=241555 RepID=UPI0004274A7E|nr:chorismate mutase [Helcococcus sueciensis]
MLQEERNKIDEIDKQIVKLFEERMETASKIAKVKKENNMEIFDSSRENLVIEKVKSYLENKELEKYLEKFYLDLMGVSKDYQKDIIEKIN